MEDGTRGVRHGFGVQVWQDGAKYKGQWYNNKAHGMVAYNQPGAQSVRSSLVDRVMSDTRTLPLAQH